VIRTKLPEVQSFLKDSSIDGWLVFDFRGTNPFATKVLNHGAGILSRRWFVWIPAQGQPIVLVHDIELGSFPNVGYEVRAYSSRESLESQVRDLISDSKTIAMEYSPSGNNPYVSKVDAGTMDMIRAFGVNVVSSGDLLQLFLTWTPQQLESHHRASAVLTETKDAALKLLSDRWSSKTPLSEYELQQYMNDLMESRGFETGHAPIIGFGLKSNDPHYVPPSTNSRMLTAGPVLMDLWCKVPGDNPYGDITWMVHVGAPSDAFMRVYNAVLESRDAGVDFLKSRLESGQTVRGFEVDQVVRKVLIDAGLEAYLKHRTGHSLGNVTTHGEAAHFDAFETLDERAIMPRLGFTIEPGAYLPEFGVRSEINVYATDRGLEITTAVQRDLDVI
jgi:Xaa-Pro aminopeptidase